MQCGIPEAWGLGLHTCVLGSPSEQTHHHHLGPTFFQGLRVRDPGRLSHHGKGHLLACALRELTARGLEAPVFAAALFPTAEVETTQVSIHGGTDAQSVAHPPSGVRLSQKEGNSDTCYHADTLGGHDARETGQSLKDEDCMSPAL